MKLLLPVDFSKESHHSLSYAKNLAVQLRAELFLLHVYYDPFVHQDMPPIKFEGTEKVTEEVLHQVDIEAKKSLQELHTAVQRELPLIAVKSLAVRGFAEKEIARFAEMYQPGLIIMGAEGGSTLMRTLGGSVTMKVVDAAIAPVLAVPAEAPLHKLNQIVYATNFHAEDEEAVRTLQSLFPASEVTISQVHIATEGEAKAAKENVETIAGDEIEDALEAYAENHPGIVLSISTHHRNTFQKIFNPGITRQLVFHSKVSVLIFGEKN